MEKPIHFVIRIQGLLSSEYASWFEDAQIASGEQADGQVVTILSGEVADQAALHGLLNRIRDLGLTLLTIDTSVKDNE